MNKKVIILLIAVVGVLLCSSPIMASENSMITYSIVDDFFGGDSIEIGDLIIEKEKYKHVDADGKVDKHTNYYLEFKVNSDSESVGTYTAKITSYNKKNKVLESFEYDISSTGDQKVKLEKSKNVDTVNIEITNENGDVVFNNTTDSIKVTKDYSKDKPAEEKSTSSSSSSSGTTYWASSNSGKFHYPSCEWAQKISGRNKVVFHSRDDALNSGYQPCQVCSP